MKDLERLNAKKFAFKNSIKCSPFNHTVKALFTREIELQLLRGTMAAIFQQSGLAPASGVRLGNSHGRPSAPALTRLRTRQSDYTSATL